MSGKLQELFNDRGEKVAYHPVVVSYTTADSNQISVAAEAKTRGHFRKTFKNCTYPPVMLQFSRSETFNTTVFKDQAKLKLVMPCRKMNTY